MTGTPRRILALAEGRFSPLKSKTANGAIAYLRDEVVAVIDSTMIGKTAQDVLGYGGDIPVVGSLQDGLAHRPSHLLIGIAPPGGRLPESWREQIRTAIKARLHLLSGLHTILSDDPEFEALSREYGVTITDYRKIPPESEVIPKASWTSRKAKVILTVGTDCNIGKMTTMLQLLKEFDKRGRKADFIATGQTGMLIRGRGIAVDSIISDYTAGCIEKEIDQSVAEGYEYIFVEGQGALTHQAYSGVTLGLIHGSMPDAFILCHQPTRLKDDYGVTLPSLEYAIRLHETVMSHFKPATVLGIALNSVGLTDSESQEWAARIEKQTGLPAVDTFRFGAVKLADALLTNLP
jgi:uncharacterized NAD-dependent epimerase/dehydratase family protein